MSLQSTQFQFILLKIIIILLINSNDKNERPHTDNKLFLGDKCDLRSGVGRGAGGR